MRAYRDKLTGLWKWGTNGSPKYETRIECERDGNNKLVERLRKIREGYASNGK